MPAPTLAPPRPAAPAPAPPAGGDAFAGRYVTPEEYLRFEEHAETKHEWIDGEVREMAGGSKRHATLNRRINARLDLAFEAEPVVGFTGDIKIRILDGPYYYCDGCFAVAPGEFEPPVRPDGEETVLLDPVLIVEVLSKSTARIDRGEKLTAYRTIPSLRDHLLFDQRVPIVEHHFRTAGGAWEKATHRGAGAELRFAAGGAPVTLGPIYAVLDKLAGPAAG